MAIEFALFLTLDHRLWLLGIMHSSFQQVNSS